MDIEPVCSSRRAVLVGAGAAAVAILGGCATYDANAPQGGVDPPVGPGENPATKPAPTASDGGGDPPATEEAPPPLARTGQIPVGGGKIIDGSNVVITQPAAGTFKAFTAVCTHQGCLVGSVENGTINCDCHGSQFRIADGSVAGGPASRPLKAIGIAVDGDAITLK